MRPRSGELAGLAALIFLILLFFWRPLTFWTIFYRDAHLLMYEFKYLETALREGFVPLWNPYVYGGRPFFASPGEAAYPFFVLFRFVDTVPAWNFLLVLHYVIAAVGAWKLARDCGLSRSASFVTGLMYSLCGFTLSTANMYVHLFGLTWIPWTIVFTRKALATASRRSFVFAAICGALPVLGGGVEATLMSSVLLVAWLLVDEVGSTPARRALFGVVVLSFSFALCLVLILPAREMIAESTRGGRLAYETITQWSVNPRRLPELFVPRFLGPTNTYTGRYWGAKLEAPGDPYILSIYFGAIGLVLAAAGATVRKGKDQLPNRTLGALALAGLVVSLGANLPFARALYDQSPIQPPFRYPIKAMMLSLLPVALLAGRGLDVIVGSAVVARRAVAAAGAALIVLSSIAAGLVISDGFAAAFVRGFFERPPAPFIAKGLVLSLSHASTGLVIAISALFLIPAGRIAAARVILTGAVALDLVAAGVSVNQWAPRNIYDAPPLARAVKRTTAARFHSTARPRGAIRLKAPSENVVWITRWYRETLAYYTAAFYAIPVTLHVDFDRLGPARATRLGDLARRAPWPHRIDIFRAAGVGAFVSIDNVGVEGVTKVMRVPSREAAPLYLYAIPSAALARFVSRVEAVPDDEAAFRRLHARLDAETAVITGPAPSVTACGSAPVTASSQTPNAVRYEVVAPCDGYVYFAENWYPGWEVTIDGSEAVLEKANYAFSAVKVSRGRHTIERRYRPRSVRAGAVASGIAMVALIACSGLVVRLPRGRLSAPPDAESSRPGDQAS